MPLVTRRRFGQLALAAPFLGLLTANNVQANLIGELQTEVDQPRDADELWVLVEDREARLSVFRGDRLIERFVPVSLGRGGAKPQRVRGDNATPLGEFRVNRFNHESQWHVFIGLDYPTLEHARLARKSGLYSDQDYDDYLAYYRRHKSPPQETVLGGYIGIHGLGRADPEIHASYHWTQGCVAVTNQQIERLAELLDIGTRVVIR